MGSKQLALLCFFCAWQLAFSASDVSQVKALYGRYHTAVQVHASFPAAPPVLAELETTLKLMYDLITPMSDEDFQALFNGEGQISGIFVDMFSFLYTDAKVMYDLSNTGGASNANMFTFALLGQLLAKAEAINPDARNAFIWNAHLCDYIADNSVKYLPESTDFEEYVPPTDRLGAIAYHVHFLNNQLQFYMSFEEVDPNIARLSQKVYNMVLVVNQILAASTLSRDNGYNDFESEFDVNGVLADFEEMSDYIAEKTRLDALATYAKWIVEHFYIPAATEPAPAPSFDSAVQNAWSLI